jgi:hypothetical protein
MGQNSSPPRRHIWLTLHAEEIIELKQLMMDRDVKETRAFFHQTVLPRVRRTAERRGISANVPSGQSEEATKADQG